MVANQCGRLEMPDEDCVYFLRRAEAELELAQRAEHPRAVAAHYRVAEHYLERVYGDVPDRIAGEGAS